MILEVAGTQYDGFSDASAEIRLDALSNTFSFGATSSKARPLPFNGGESCKVFVDGEQVLRGHIELVSASGDSRSHSISVQGRDGTGDLLDSTIGSLGQLQAPLTMKGLCEKVIKHVGASIKVVDEVKPKPFTQVEDIADPDPGDNAFSFLEKYARKRQVLLTSDFDGNLVIAQGSGEEIGASIINRIGDPFSLNNVLSWSVSYDQTGRYNLYRSVSQLNPTAGVLAGDTDALTIASQGHKQSAVDEQIRHGRQMILVSEAMTSSGDPSKDRATWEANVRKARGRVYSCTVNGYRNETGALWAINTLPIVLDEEASITARLLLNSVAFKIDRQQGRVTTLSFVERNAFTLSLEEPIATKEDLGSGLF